MQPLRLGRWAGGVLLALMVAGATARGQFVVDRVNPPRMPGPQPPARNYEVRAVSMDARVRDGVAEVRVTQTFHNPGSAEIEAEYLFPLPDDSAVGDLILMVDGKELPGRVLPKAEARSIYEGIVRSKRDPALLEYMGRGLFRASVFPIPAGADRVVTLRYTQVLRRERDVVELSLPLAAQKQVGRPIGRLDVSVRVDGASAIKSVYSPAHDARIERPSEREAIATLAQQDVLPTSDFRLVYTLGEGAVGASLLSYRPSDGEDGYFLLLASPRVRPVDDRPLPKTVVFVLDRSGSMAGKKLDQAKAALQFVLNNLRDDDTFNIVGYDENVETYKPELQRYNAASRAEASRFVDNIRSGGGTNINGALVAALGQIPDDSRPNYVIFLTDGLATSGETAELRISQNAKVANKGRARVFSFGVGFDVNARLLDRLSGGSGGTSEYVRPDEDIEAHVGAFYSKMTRPALASPTIELAGLDVNRTYPRDLPDLFEGGQIAWVGRYPRGGPTTIRIAGKVGAERQNFEFPAELAGTGSASGREFVARLWAVRRIGAIIDQIDLNGANSELTDELVALSTRYGILTPYTSFLADERVNLHAAASNRREAGRNLEALRLAEGEVGVNQRGLKQAFNQASRDNSFDTVPADRAKDRLAWANSALAKGYTPASLPAGAQPGGAQMGPGGSFAGGGGGIGGGMGGMGGGMMPNPHLAQAGRFPVVVGTAPGASNFQNKPAGQAAQAPASQVAQSGGVPARLRQAMASGPVAAAAPAADSPTPDAALNVRRIGSKTFFRKNGRWVDSAVKPEDEAKAVALEQFGPAYFDLAAKQTAEQNQYLAVDEPVTVRIADQVYKIDPPAIR